MDALAVVARINGINYDVWPAHPDDPISASSIARTAGMLAGDFTINSLYLFPDGELLDSLWRGR